MLLDRLVLGPEVVTSGMRPNPAGEPPMGPLNTERFRRAKTGRDGDPGIRFAYAWRASWEDDVVSTVLANGLRLTRMLEGKVVPVGVVGNSFTDE